MQHKSTRRRVVPLLLALAVLAAALGLSASPASANESGCNGSVCIFVSGTGTWVDYITATNSGSGWPGHMHIYTSNGLIDSNNADHNPVVTHFVGWGGLMPNYTQICAEGWQLNSPGSYTLKGRPCVVVHT